MATERVTKRSSHTKTVRQQHYTECTLLKGPIMTKKKIISYFIIFFKNRSPTIIIHVQLKFFSLNFKEKNLPKLFIFYIVFFLEELF